MTNTHSTARFAGLALALLGPLARPAAAQTSDGYAFHSLDYAGTGGATTVNGVSNGGALVGFYSTDGAHFTNFAGQPGSLAALTSLGSAANANGINKGGVVVGADGAGNAFRLDGSTVSTLPAFNGTTTSQTAFGIDDQNAVVGSYTDSATGKQSGFVYGSGAFSASINPIDATVTFAQGLNNNGSVTGFYATAASPVQHGFFYDINSGTFTLPSDPSTARTQAGGLALTQFLGLNDAGEAVGYYQTNNGSQFGFLYDTKTSAYTFLDDPLAAPVNGVQITQITGVNNAGEIAGFYVDAGGAQRGFYATPGAAPEPSQAAALGLGALTLAGLTLRARRRSARG